MSDTWISTCYTFLETNIGEWNSFSSLCAQGWRVTIKTVVTRWQSLNTVPEWGSVFGICGIFFTQHCRILFEHIIRAHRSVMMHLAAVTLLSRSWAFCGECRNCYLSKAVLPTCELIIYSQYWLTVASVGASEVSISASVSSLL